MVKKNSIPDRWRSLKAIGQRVPGSRFIAFKVPLKGVNNQRVTQTQKFTPKDLLTSIRSQNEELGLIIDLTNTERYYTTKDLPKSVQYVKLHTVGLKIPDDATIHQFKRVVWKFLAANSDNDRLIGVHCTTGINRTGYLICRYLIDVDEWRPLTALSAFGQSRGHPIEGTVYIEDIVKGPPRSNIGIDLPPAIDEPREMDNDPYNDDMLRDRQSQGYSMKSILENIPRNEYEDFDARDRRPLPLMRARSGEYQDNSRDVFNPNLRPEFRNRRLPFGDMDDDIDLRMPSERRGIPSGMSGHLNAPERLQRPADFNPDGRFQSGPENRQNLYGSEPRPLMDLRDGPNQMQRPRGMQHEQGGYNDRMQGYDEYNEPPSNRVPPFPPGRMNSAEYGDQEAPRQRRSLINELDYLDRLRRQEVPSVENENDRFDPRDHEMMSGGPYNEKMQPRNVRAQEGPMNNRMNARNPQLHNESLNETWDMEGPVPERIHPRNPMFIEGSVNERFPQRGAQGFRNPADQRMHLQDGRSMNGPMAERMQSRDAQFMEGPMNNRMYSRDPRQTEASGNNPTQTRVARLMDLPMNQRLNPRDGQAMENSMNDRMPPRDSRPLTRGMNTMMNPRDSRPMEGPLNTRMHPRIDRTMMEGPMNDQMYSREANEHMPLRDTRPMEGHMNERMYQQGAPTMMQRSMNEQMHPQNTQTVERPMTERMYPQAEGYPINKQRDFMNDARPFEGRKVNPSENVFRGTNRFAPYPTLMKPGQPTGPPRQDNRDPREMLPPSQDPNRFPRRTRFN